LPTTTSREKASFRFKIEREKETMRDYVGDLLFGGFVIIMVVIFLRDWSNATQLVQGFAGTYTQSVTSLANLGNPANA
jgi:hypothetical protein